MLFSRDKLDLGAVKSRAVIDASRCIEVCRGEPTEVLSTKTDQPIDYSGPLKARATFFVEVLTTNGLYSLELRFERNRKGSWHLKNGWMTFGEERYFVRGHFGGYPSRSPELIVDAISIAVIGVEGKKNHAIYGTSWIHRILWPDTSGAVIDDALAELYRAKS